MSLWAPIAMAVGWAVTVPCAALYDRRQQKQPRLVRLILVPDHAYCLSKGNIMTNSAIYSQPDATPEHYTLSGLDQFGRNFPLTQPATIAGNDAQTALDANGLGVTVTLTVGGTATFTLAEGALALSATIDSPPAVLTSLALTPDSSAVVAVPAAAPAA